MIDLQICEYCKNCPEFEVKQETLRMGFCDSSHLLMCEHANKCKNIYKYLKESEQ